MKKIILTTLLIFSAGCLATSNEPPKPPQPSGNVVGLKTFESCEDLRGFLESKIEVEPLPLDAPVADSEEGTAERAPSETVEEADIVKREGNRLYVVNATSGLLAYDLSDAAHPTRVGQLELDLVPQEIYVEGSKAMVVGSSRVVVIDLSNPSSPVELLKRDLEGTYSTSRKVGSSVYLVLENWISQYNLDDRLEQESPCDSVYVPEEIESGDYFSLTSWNLVGIDFDHLSEEPEKVTVIGSYDSEITATPDHLYLTNLFYEEDKTGVYLFGLDSDGASIVPLASASVPGRIVDQFSMDETDGFFRIATTTNRSTFGAADNRNYLTIFKVEEEGLTQAGQIDSITPGESITAARFLGDRAFVTTYVTKDPLVSIDLSDPASPKIMGELEVPGYASYLHPWGDLLISIGSSWEFWGEVILSLFDVSDLANPRLVEQITLEGSYNSEAQTEHRAFSFFEDRAVLAIPLSLGSNSKIAVFSVSREEGFTSLGTISHDDLLESGNGYSPQMRRSLEIDDQLYTISEAGLKVSSFADLSDSFGEMFPDFEPPVYYGCDCPGDVCACGE